MTLYPSYTKVLLLEGGPLLQITDNFHSMNLNISCHTRHNNPTQLLEIQLSLISNYA